MPAYKDNRQGTWYASFYFENWQGVKQKKLKRGFATKKDALAWEREFLLQQAADLTMTFEAFVEIYITDKKKRLRENTWFTKEHIIRTKILPYFKEKRLSEIKPRDVIAWQNEMLNYRDKNGKAYSPTYLKTLHGQLSAILNHAVRFYGLKSNAAATAGCMGSEKHKEMLFWTKEEYLKFAEVMMDKPQSYYAFEVLYWCGIREGELLALTPADFDLDKGLLSITKSYQRLKGRDVITDPKTPKSVRVIQMPQFLTDEIRDYLKSLYKVQPDQRIFEVTKSYLHHEMDRGAKAAGVKRIRIHDLRHPYVKHTTKKYNSEKQKYCPFTVSRYCRRIVSRLMAFTRDTSMPESWMSAGIRSTPSGWCRMPSPGLIGSSMRIRPIASDRVKGSLSGCGLPRLMVRLPCGSASTSSTFFPACASPMPKLAQVVVLPTPPFWLATAMICGFNDFTSFLIGCCHVPA